MDCTTLLLEHGGKRSQVLPKILPEITPYMFKYRLTNSIICHKNCHLSSCLRNMLLNFLVFLVYMYLEINMYCYVLGMKYLSSSVVVKGFTCFKFSQY